MTNYDLMIQSYENVLEQKPEKCDVEAMKLSINALKTLNNKTDDEIYAIFSTGAFNDILKGYCKKALENCEVDKKQIDAVIDELKWLLDTCSVKDML